MSVTLNFSSGTSQGTNYVRVGNNSSINNPDAIWSFVATSSNAYKITGLSFTFSWDNTGSGWSGEYTYRAVISSSASGSSIKTVEKDLSGHSGTWNINFTGLSLNPSTKYYIRLDEKSGSYSTMKMFSKTASGSVSSTQDYVKPTVSAPAAKTVDEGSNATFSVAASGGVPSSYSYQWQLSKNGGSTYSNISGKTSSTITVATTKSMNGYRYRCKVTNDAGSTTSSSALLTVYYPMVLKSSYPQDKAINVNSANTFKVSIESAGNPSSYTYQWQQSTNNGSSYSNISGETSSSLSVTASKAMNGYKYRCKVTNSYGTVTSRAATLTVYYPMVLNSSYPANTTINVGEKATLSVKISIAGYPASYTYQWYNSSGAIGGATYSTYTTPNLAYSSTGYNYYCKVKHTQTATIVTSRTAKVSISGYKPTATVSQSTVKINENSTLTLSGTITVGEPASTSYKWQVLKNGASAYIDLTAAATKTTSGSISNSIQSISYSEYNKAKFRLVVTNTIGSNYSGTITLTVNRKPATPQLVFPKNNTSTYNTKPYFLFKYGDDADGDALTGYLSIGSTVYNCLSANWINNGKKTTAEQSIIKANTTALGNTISVRAYSNDGMIESDKVIRTINIKAPNFTDAIAAGTAVKAVHITELRSKINELEAYYGLSISSWTDTLTSGSTVKGSHFQELRNGVDRIKNYLNSFGANIAITWTDSSLKDKRIKAVHINEIRSAIQRI